MFHCSIILASGLALAAALVGCGQQGPLYLPTDAASANRATLPQTLLPNLAPGSNTDASPTPTAAPAAKPASR